MLKIYKNIYFGEHIYTKSDCTGLLDDITDVCDVIVFDDKNTLLDKINELNLDKRLTLFVTEPDFNIEVYHQALDGHISFIYDLLTYLDELVQIEYGYIYEHKSRTHLKGGI